MKMYSKILFSLCSVILLISCTKSELDVTYSGDAFVFFASNNSTDQYFYSFSENKSVEFKEYLVPVKIMGDTSDRSRRVNVTVVGSETTAQPSEYQLGEGIVPAGSSVGYIPVKLFSTARLETDTVRLHISLQDSPDFKVGLPRAQQEFVGFNIVWTNVIARPVDWPTAWGGFSKTKYKLVVDLTGRTEYSGEGWDNTVLYGILGLCNDWLYNYELANPGNPYRDENGEIIRFCSNCK